MANLKRNAPKQGHKFNCSENFCSNPTTGGSRVECKKRCAVAESKKIGAKDQANESPSDLSRSRDGLYALRKNEKKGRVNKFFEPTQENPKSDSLRSLVVSKKHIAFLKSSDFIGVSKKLNADGKNSTQVENKNGTEPVPRKGPNIFTNNSRECKTSFLNKRIRYAVDPPESFFHLSDNPVTLNL